MNNEILVYSKIGMALISAQRVEYITGELLNHLKEFDKEIYGITPAEFLDDKRHGKKHKTLGDIFSLLKLNSKLVIGEELSKYKDARNILAHSFWREFLFTKNDQQAALAVDFCNDFGANSEKLESFFKGFIYFLALRHVQDSEGLDNQLKKWQLDFDYFLFSVKSGHL